MSSPYPSGRQFEIAYGSLHATVVEVGGGLRTLSAGDWQVLDGFGAGEMCHDARGQILIPWPNRLAGGRYAFDGQEYQLPINEPARDAAIHGLVRWATWGVAAGAGSVTMSHRLYPQPGYPFTLGLTAAYTLTETGLQVELTAANPGPVACPFGAGQHPYLHAGTDRIDEALLRIPARTAYNTDANLIPTGTFPVAGTPLDFQQFRPIGDTVINTDFTDLQRDADGMARVHLQAPGSGPAIDVWMDGAFKHIVVYTGETVQPPSRRRRSLAIEPMTCPPNAFNSGQDLIVLRPGEVWRGRWGITIHPAG